MEIAVCIPFAGNVPASRGLGFYYSKIQTAHWSQRRIWPKLNKKEQRTKLFSTLYFGLQYKPSSGAEWKKYMKRKLLHKILNKNAWQWLVGYDLILKCQISWCYWRASSLLFMPNGCNVLALFIKWASRAFLAESSLLRMSSIGMRRTSLMEWPAWLKCSCAELLVCATMIGDNDW